MPVSVPQLPLDHGHRPLPLSVFDRQIYAVSLLINLPKTESLRPKQMRLLHRYVYGFVRRATRSVHDYASEAGKEKTARLTTEHQFDVRIYEFDPCLIIVLKDVFEREWSLIEAIMRRMDLWSKDPKKLALAAKSIWREESNHRAIDQRCQALCEYAKELRHAESRQVSSACPKQSRLQQMGGRNGGSKKKKRKPGGNGVKKVPPQPTPSSAFERTCRDI